MKKTGAHVSDTRRLDARLRVRGFEEEQVESVSAPTINNNTARAASSIVPLKKWEFWVIDISRAYLQSKDSGQPGGLRTPPGSNAPGRW